MKFRVEQACDEPTHEHLQHDAPQHAHIPKVVLDHQQERDGENMVYFLHEQHLWAPQRDWQY